MARVFDHVQLFHTLTRLYYFVAQQCSICLSYSFGCSYNLNSQAEDRLSGWLVSIKRHMFLEGFILSSWGDFWDSNYLYRTFVAVSGQTLVLNSFARYTVILVVIITRPPNLNLKYALASRLNSARAHLDKVFAVVAYLLTMMSLNHDVSHI